jgi:hypothetical protein
MLGGRLGIFLLGLNFTNKIFQSNSFKNIQWGKGDIARRHGTFQESKSIFLPQV